MADHHPEWGPRIEYAVRYVSSTLNPGQSPIRFAIMATKELAQRAVTQRIPRSGEQHTLVRRTVTDWEEA